MSDVSSLSDEVNRVKFNERDLKKLIQKYNMIKCKQKGDCIEFSPAKENDVAIDLGISLAYGQPDLTFDPALLADYFGFSDRIDFNSNKYMAVSFTFEFKIPQLSKRIGVRIAPTLFNYYFNSHTSYKSFYSYDQKINFNLTGIKAPLIFRYTYNPVQWKIHPHVGAGYWCAVFLKSGSELTYKINTGTTEYSGKYDDFPLSDNQLGPVYTAGFEVPLKKSKIAIGISYENGSGIDGIGGYNVGTTKTKMLAFQVGYEF